MDSKKKDTVDIKPFDKDFLSDVGLITENDKKNPAVPDWRHIANGFKIPTELYSDQPYVVKTDDGAWLCIVTTCAGHEGQNGQHVIAMRSTDQGKTWSKPVDVEPGSGPEASYAVLLKVPGGRIFCLYNHNSDNIRKVKADNPPYSDGFCYRVDSLGYYVFKYSDDHGRTWSGKRYSIPVREMEIDRKNADGGKIRYFWNVGKPFILNEAAYCSLHKVGGFGPGFFTSTEGILLKSSNILTERDPEKITWETLPDGDTGLRTPPGGGSVSEEHSYSVLTDGSIYCTYRSIDGHPVFSYSRNGGHTWDVPQYKCYADGRRMKHPRAANFAWKCTNGKYLYWFHNHGGLDYEDRNPVWVCGGVEADTEKGKVIKWSQPEIFIYDDDTYIRISYPDLIEEDGKVFITETKKDVARVHEIDDTYLKRLWNQFDHTGISEMGLILDLCHNSGTIAEQIEMPGLPEFMARSDFRAGYGTMDLRQGFTIEMWVVFKDLEENQIVLDSRTEEGQGLCLYVADHKTLEIILNDGRTENRWKCDPGTLEEGKLHHFAVIVDGGPKVITFVIDGKFNDGGDFRQFGWGRFSPNIRHVNGSDVLKTGTRGRNDIKVLRIYSTALSTSEVIGNYRAGIDI